MVYTHTIPGLRSPGLRPRSRPRLGLFQSDHMSRVQVVHLPRANRMDNAHIFPAQTTKNHIVVERKKKYLFATPNSDIVIPDGSASSVFDVITKLYTCINEKKLEELDEIIASDCFLEDFNFPHSFQGKKEVMRFFGQLVESMCENVHFRIGTICEGGELMATVDWHLEWKEDRIPFSRGNSYFQCSFEDEKLVIRKAQIICESPFKPGELSLGLLKIFASLFDDFPKAAKWFLRSPHTIFKVVSTIYNMLFAPILNPIFVFYIILWKFVVRLLGYLIGILRFIAKIIDKMSSNGNHTTQG